MKLSDLNIARSRLVELADEYIYNPRNKTLFLKKIEGYTYDELSEMYNLSTVRTKEIVKECFEKISKHT